jgi:DNA-binding IclR family transcriptional regulator
MAEPKNRVQSVDIACQLLRELQTRETAGITELADELDYAKSAVHTQLATLEANELVVKDGTSYRLSLRFLDMAESVKSQISKYDVIVSEVKSLAAETDEVVHFGTEEHDWLVYLCKEKGDKGVETSSSIGRREYLHLTGMGKAILSTYPRERVEEIVDRRGLPANTENTITSRSELFDELETIRERGYAVDNQENITGVRCIAVPIENEDGETLGALSVTGPSRRLTDDRLETELEEAVSKAANVIQVNYKFS